MISKTLNLGKQKGSSLMLRANGQGGSSATVLAAHFAKQNTKFGGDGKRGRAKIPSPQPLPFCPPERFGFAREARNYSEFCSKNVRTSSKKHRQVLHSAKLKDVASALRASAWYFSAILKAFLKSKTKVRSAMRKFTERSSGKMKFCKPIFFLSLSAKG